jgi:predicted CXXCH cytochrome family protein
VSKVKRFKLLAMVALATVLLAVGLTAWATPASANAGPHGGYTLTTSACAGCHRAHTAIGPSLLRADSVYALCTSCHGGSVTTDVVHGVLTGGSNKPLNGGGFEQQNGKAVTSSHTVEGLGGATGQGTAWGSQNGDGTPVSDLGVGVQGELECTSCHNPHGSTNYRLLNDASTTSKWVPNDPDLLNFVSYQVLATRDDSPNYGFDVTSVSDCPSNPGTPGPGTKCLSRYTSGIFSGSGLAGFPDVTKGMNAFCSTCHKSYLTRASSPGFNSLNTPEATVGPGTPTRVPAEIYPGLQDANDGHGLVARYRHSVDRTKGSAPKQPLRFAAEGIDPNPPGSLVYDAMGCLMCHFAHGSGSAATGEAAGVAPTNDSALLFYDNRGVCISCHQTVGSPATLTPTATSTPVPPTATPTP